MKKKLRLSNGMLFLLAIVFSYIFLFFMFPSVFNPAIGFFMNLIKQIYWVFIIVFLLMVFFNYFFTRERVLKHLGKGSGIKAWVFSVVFGILSMGPIYAWYPLLNDLKEKGMRPGLIACFLYNRGIKIPLLPVMVFYFNFNYVLIVTFLMIIFSVIYGIIIEKLVGDDFN